MSLIILAAKVYAALFLLGLAASIIAVIVVFVLIFRGTR